ncbi:MAG: hypothetical protein AABY13_03365 [Nanoarchaeota archaeon]
MRKTGESMQQTVQVMCQRCSGPVQSLSPMRKWCVECRRLVSLEQARARKYGLEWPSLHMRK